MSAKPSRKERIEEARRQKAMQKRKRLLGIAAVLVIGCCAYAFNQFYLGSPKRLANQWLEAVQQGDSAAAIELANRLIGDTGGFQASSIYKNMSAKNGLEPSFLEAGFNEWDLRYWKNTLFFHQEANKVATDDNQALQQLFHAVDERLACGDPAGKQTLWPKTIWDSEKGLCDRQAWVLCELAYQLGMRAHIVYLRDPKTDVSPHTICEVRKGDMVWVADPFSSVLLEDVSIQHMAENGELGKKAWPDRLDWQVAIQNPIYWTPSYPQAYCKRNQVLGKRLKELLGDAAPRFGEDPYHRAVNYKSLCDRKTGGANQDNPFDVAVSLWPYPFQLLAIDMKRASN